MLVAVSAVAVADILLKKAAVGEAGLVGALKSPWVLGAVLLYLLQIFLFLLAFESHAKLSWVGVMQTGIYACITLGAGFLYFGESLTAVQTVGVVCTIIGVVLLNV